MLMEPRRLQSRVIAFPKNSFACEPMDNCPNRWTRTVGHSAFQILKMRFRVCPMGVAHSIPSSRQGGEDVTPPRLPQRVGPETAGADCESHQRKPPTAKNGCRYGSRSRATGSWILGTVVYRMCADRPVDHYDEKTARIQKKDDLFVGIVKHRRVAVCPMSADMPRFRAQNAARTRDPPSLRRRNLPSRWSLYQDIARSAVVQGLVGFLLTKRTSFPTRVSPGCASKTV
jgi:hypothetical protein